MPHESEIRTEPDAIEDASLGGVATGAWVLALVICTFFALSVRLFNIETASFFNDELYSVQTAADFEGTNLSKRLGYVPTRIALELANVDLDALDVTRPETWMDAGITERALRLPHAVIGALTIPLLMLAGKRVLGANGSVVFGLLLAIATWHVYWSQGARFYIVQFLFFNLALLLWIGSARERRPIGYTLAMLCAFLGFWSQPHAGLIFVIMGLDWLWSYVRKDPIRLAWWQWMVGAISAGGCAALIGIDLTQRTEQWSQFIGQDRWIKPQQMVLGVVYWVWPPAAAFAGLAGLWLWAKRPRVGVPLVLAAALPVALFTVMAAFAFIGTRYAFICLGPILAIVAVGLVRVCAEIQSRAGALLALAPAAMVVIGQLLATAIYFRSGGNFHVPMRDAIQYIDAQNVEGLPVYAHEDEIVRYYAQTGEVVFLPRTVDEIAAIREPAWFIFQVSHAGTGDNRALVDGMELERRFALMQVHSSQAIDVYRYTPPGVERP
ncbi:MAG: glycosyltransferase family 39 protein [Phycisphaerales bacterium]